MVKTHGLTHIALKVRDPERSLRFYEQLFGVREAERAGGKLLRRGEFSPGYPFAYVADPDGYEIEIWFE